jgi:hypothetical protein
MERRRDRRLLHRRERRVETTGLATQALLKWGRPRRPFARLSTSSPRRRRPRQLGHHAGHHHGPARAGPRHANSAHPMCAARLRGSAYQLNGKPVESSQLTPENNDLLHQFVFKACATGAIGSARTLERKRKVECRSVGPRSGGELSSSAPNRLGYANASSWRADALRR